MTPLVCPLTRPAALLHAGCHSFPCQCCGVKAAPSNTQSPGQCLAHRPCVYDIQTHAYLICICIIYRLRCPDSLVGIANKA